MYSILFVSLMLSAALLPLKPHSWLLMDYFLPKLYQSEEQTGKKQDVNQSFFKEEGQIDEPCMPSLMT
jgi:hypothetical protein